ncbi:hypothetical protein C0Q70_04348 [Pomacea canaliculata]|uniref:Uncharacterized protein n=1 Tax=Pomacea canaliculata TaxID=400727 RepID=A0A2T7PVA3_POMCA|nr:hypothetical protein C0Q70_04348 [Pomacea canaliculata]
MACCLIDVSFDLKHGDDCTAAVVVVTVCFLLSGERHSRVNISPARNGAAMSSGSAPLFTRLQENVTCDNSRLLKDTSDALRQTQLSGWPQPSSRGLHSCKQSSLHFLANKHLSVHSAGRSSQQTVINRIPHQQSGGGGGRRRRAAAVGGGGGGGGDPVSTCGPHLPNYSSRQEREARLSDGLSAKIICL